MEANLLSTHDRAPRSQALQRQLVLVTGPPRSGTTVVGTQLGLAEACAALYEPMNGDSGDKAISHYFARPGRTGLSLEDFDDLVHRIATLGLHLKPGVFRHEKGWRRFAKQIVGGQSRHSLRLAKLSTGLETVIWKDPFAAFAARVAIKRFDIPVVITYRPPEAVVASFKRLNWYFDVHNMSSELGKDRLGQGPQHKRGERDVVDGAAALWSMVYSELFSLARARPDKVCLVRMDDIIQDPRHVYFALLERLGLRGDAPFLKGIVKAEMQRDDSGQQDLPSGHPHSKTRNVRAANAYWRQILSEEEIAAVRKLTARTEALVRDLSPVGALI